MRKITNLIGLMLLFAMFSVRAEAADPGQSPPTMLDGKPKIVDKVKAVACDCCKKCLAAKKPVKSKEEGPPATNGCRDCCERCGPVKPLTPDKIPPEIIKKK
jgi:hypothetical protein